MASLAPGPGWVKKLQQKLHRFFVNTRNFLFVKRAAPGWKSSRVTVNGA